MDTFAIINTKCICNKAVMLYCELWPIYFSNKLEDNGSTDS